MSDCPGMGQCHGCMDWCDSCGTVNQVCDGPGLCDEHLPCTYPGCARVGRDGVCSRHDGYYPDETVREVMES